MACKMGTSSCSFLDAGLKTSLLRAKKRADVTKSRSASGLYLVYIVLVIGSELNVMKKSLTVSQTRYIELIFCETISFLDKMLVPK